MSVTSKTVGQKEPSVAVSKQDIAPRSILERVQAFVELRFPVTIKELKYFKEQKDIRKLETDQLQDLMSFFLNEFDYEDAVHFL